MSVETINDCVVFPHQINWRDGAAWERHWKSDVSAAVTSAEDRSTGATKPDIKQTVTSNAFTPQEGYRRAARILAALKSGRCVIPYFLREQYFADYPADPAVEQEAGPNDLAFDGLDVGKVYYYEDGLYDLALNYGPSLFLYSRGYFVAGFTEIFLTVSGGTSNAGKIQRVQFFDFCNVTGLWQWAVGQYAFWLRRRPRSDAYRHENKTWLQVCGNAAPVGWFSDALFATGGSYVTTSHAIDTSLVTEPAPVQVYQQARLYSGSVTSEILFTIDALHVDIPCRVRLHFAEIEDGFDGTIARRCFDVQVIGGESVNQVFENVEPFQMAGWVLNKASILDFQSLPYFDGTLQIKLVPRVTEVQYTLDGNFDVSFIFSGSLGERVLLKSQTSAAENGVYEIGPGGILFRIRISLGASVHVGSGSAVQANTYWRCTTPEPIQPGTTALTFEKIVTPATIFHAGINGIEFYQHLWDVKLLQAGTTTSKLKFDGFLKSAHAGGNPMFPALFGKLSVPDQRMVTDHLAEGQVTVEEPLGTGDLAVTGVCPAPVCNDDEKFIAVDPLTLLIDPPDIICGGGFTPGSVFPTVSHGGNSYPLKSSTHPGTPIPANVVAFMLSAATTYWSENTVPGVTGLRYVWRQTGLLGWIAEDAINDSWLTLTGTWWVIAIEWCEPV